MAEFRRFSPAESKISRSGFGAVRFRGIGILLMIEKKSREELGSGRVMLDPTSETLAGVDWVGEYPEREHK